MLKSGALYFEKMKNEMMLLLNILDKRALTVDNVRISTSIFVYLYSSLFMSYNIIWEQPLSFVIGRYRSLSFVIGRNANPYFMTIRLTSSRFSSNHFLMG